jgi:hypothetical protein
VIYTCVLVTAMMAVYFYRGWRTLMWACTLGGWAVLMAATHAAEDTGQGMAAVQAGLAFGWLAFGLLPVLREVARDGNRERWLCPPFGIAERMLAPPGIRVLAQHVHLACVSSPLLALMLSRALWDGRITDRSFGWLTLATAAVYGGWAWGLGRLAALESLARTQRLVAILLSTIGLCLILDGEARFLALATEAGVLHVLRRRLPGRLTLFATHALSVVVALLAIVRLLEHGPDLEPGFTASSFATLWAFVVAAGVALLSSGTVRVVYALGAHVGFLAWLARELQPMADGAAYLTIAWAVHGLLLLAVGAWRHADQLRTLGLLTLLLAVAKLILFDLAQLEAIWRVLLFMGFGALFLVISYYARSLWRPDDEPPTSTTELP